MTIQNILILLTGHILVGYSITLIFSWSWIPLTKEERSRGKSLSSIQKHIS